MITDPATTPTSARSQIVFAIAVALAYTTLVYLHIVFDLFFALVAVCMGRGILLHVAAYRAAMATRPFAPPVVVAEGRQFARPQKLVEAGAAV
jgi:hypothetical protein